MTLKLSTADGSGLEWVKSSYSSDDGPACVEVAATSGTVRVRDSKNKPGPQLAVTPTTWAVFVSYAATN
ncbi:DUF397 domain-containing protein [Streptomyces smyrnaeus]|uniref:DUF397 domain-containing protein n=1 Tax=Streptomyces TaxID=1883 RepID=UPI000C17C8E6|nr:MULTISPECIES: DUF397 domain-containing protein [unclassified Streptomyces]MBQ0866785.1 DUF397 domain-containing protein [Streptomyces sp. RK75]MBQ1121620.1 DUF397 domain-containing protein [Streptomyces sp. B15]